MRLLLAFLFATTCFSAPNIVFLMTDDRGLETCVPDGNVNGWVTPEIDSIATGGMRFSRMNSEVSCSPSRALLLTGRWPNAANRLDPNINFPTLSLGPLDTNEVTIADILGDVGYVSATAGKWNLYYGDETTNATIVAEAEQHAKDCGFDYAFIPNPGNTPVTYWSGGEGVGDYLPDTINSWATNWMADRVASNETFFLTYSFHLIHILGDASYQVTPNNLGETNETDAVKAQGMWEYHDVLVGNVLDQIDALGIADNTIVIYCGDNGTDSSLTNSYNGTPITGGKIGSDETASRVPFYVKWPGTITPASTYDGLSSFADVLPTLAEIAGTYQRGGQLNDGVSFYGGLLGTESSHRKYILEKSRLALDAYKDLNWKWLDNGNLYSITNWPHGDVETTPTDVLHSNTIINLSTRYTNDYFKAYGDRPWYGSTNEYIFHRP